MHNMTDDDLFQKGLEVQHDPTWDGGWMRGGRPVTNVEMSELIGIRGRIKAAAIEAQRRFGCCGHGSECYRVDGVDEYLDGTRREWTSWRCPITNEPCERRMASELIRVFGFLNRRKGETNERVDIDSRD